MWSGVDLLSEVIGSRSVVVKTSRCDFGEILWLRWDADRTTAGPYCGRWECSSMVEKEKDLYKQRHSISEPLWEHLAPGIDDRTN
jgi:hypothetical protein